MTQPLSLNGSETTVFVNSLKTLTNESVTFAEFTPFTRGIIVVDPEAQFGTQPEIISFTGVDTTNIAYTGAIRGLSAVSASVIAANKVYHGVNTPVIISWGAQNISDLITYINTLLAGTAGNASSTVTGVTKLSINPVSSLSPIAVGDNDTRVPTAGQTSYLASISGYTLNTAADTGSANAYAIAPSPSIGAYAAGQIFTFKAVNGNSTASTLAVNGLTAKAIKKQVSTALSSGDIAAGQDVIVMYDGTNFQLLSPLPIVSLGLYNSGIITHDITSTTTNTIPHGFGVVPKLVRVTAVIAGASSGPLSYALAVNSSAISVAIDGGANTSSATSTTFVIYSISQPIASSAFITGTITYDATNITITWVKSNSPTGTANLLWEAQA